MESINTQDGKKSFVWLNIVQFFGALNDNLFKFLLVFFLIDTASDVNEEKAMIITAIVFVIPFILFSNAGGVLADKFSKRDIIVKCKAAEFVIMLLGCAAFLIHSPALGCVALFLMSTQSAIFGPSKYGILPELVGSENLSRANGLIQLFTYAAIILGTTLSGIITDPQEMRYASYGLYCVLFSGIGLGASFFLSATPSAGADGGRAFNFLGQLWETFKDVRHDRQLITAVVSSAYFLLLAAYIQMELIPYGVNVLHYTKEHCAYLFPIMAMGIGVGAVLAGRISGRSIEFGIVPIGALGMMIACLLLVFFPLRGDMTRIIFTSDMFPLSLMETTSPGISSGELGVFFSLLLLGVSAGLFIIPLSSFIQFRAPLKVRGKVLALNSFLSFAGVALAPVLLFALTSMGVGPLGRLVFMAALTLLLFVVSIIVLPDFLVRFIVILVTRTIYRIKVRQGENLPTHGPALLMPNHVTFIDALLLSATTQRRIKFVMHKKYYTKPMFHPVCRLMGAIPIAHDDPKMIVKALKKAREYLDEGYIVCIFGEGALTRTGHMHDIKPGYERILKGSDYPIVPANFHGAWGSLWSYFHGEPWSSLKTRFPYPVTISYGKSLPSSASAFEIRQAIQELGADAAIEVDKDRSNIGRLFISTAHKKWGHRAMVDSTGKDLTYGKALVGALALLRVFTPHIRESQKVGVLMPSSVSGALTNIALILGGKVPVNLNFTASPSAVEHAIKASDITTIISSRAFLEKVTGFSHLPGLIYLEDLAQQITPILKLQCLIKAFTPARMLVSKLPDGGDTLVTIIFSSGSTGVPKGVMLSHHNIVTNVDSLGKVFRVTSDENILSALPLFHSFGFTAAVWLPLLNGFTATYHNNPLDGGVIAELAKKYKATMLVATPTFLLAYIRKAKKEDFESLRRVIVGAEKLKMKIADSFEKKFGIRPLEGYGATELAPVASCNINDVEGDLGLQHGTKNGTIGHALPGVAAMIRDIDDGHVLPPGEQGLMYIKGPNVMLGYLNQEEKTQEVLQDGWYNTGDIARMDKEGFITITDRLSRFSKIAGEMVSHVAVEDVYVSSLSLTTPSIAVTAVPDEKKGEKLVVLFTSDAGSAEELQNIMSKADVPNLWKPRSECYLRVEELPLLGTGKLDLQGLKKTAQSLLGISP